MATAAPFTSAAPTPHEIENVRIFAYYGNVKGVRAAVNNLESRFPWFLQTTEGRLILRLATIYAIGQKHLGVLKYLCLERKVPTMAEYREEFGTSLVLIFYLISSFPLYPPPRLALSPCTPPALLRLRASLCITAHPMSSSHISPASLLSLFISLNFPLQNWRCVRATLMNPIWRVAIGGPCRWPPESICRIIACACSLWRDRSRRSITSPA